MVVFLYENTPGGYQYHTSASGFSVPPRRYYSIIRPTPFDKPSPFAYHDRSNWTKIPVEWAPWYNKYDHSHRKIPKDWLCEQNCWTTIPPEWTAHTKKQPQGMYMYDATQQYLSIFSFIAPCQKLNSHIFASLFFLSFCQN